MSKVLIIEENDPTANGFANALSERGIEVLSSPEGHGGYADILEFEPDAVVLNLNLPEMSGLDILRGYRPHRRRMPVKFVAYGSVDKAMEQKASRAGADVVLGKSPTAANIIEAVETALRSLEEEKRMNPGLFVNLDQPVATTTGVAEEGQVTVSSDDATDDDDTDFAPPIPESHRPATGLEADVSEPEERDDTAETGADDEVESRTEVDDENFSPLDETQTEDELSADTPQHIETAEVDESAPDQPQEPLSPSSEFPQPTAEELETAKTKRMAHPMPGRKSSSLFQQKKTTSLIDQEPEVDEMEEPQEKNLEIIMPERDDKLSREPGHQPGSEPQAHGAHDNLPKPPQSAQEAQAGGGEGSRLLSKPPRITTSFKTTPIVPRKRPRDTSTFRPSMLPTAKPPKNLGAVKSIQSSFMPPAPGSGYTSGPEGSPPRPPIPGQALSPQISQESSGQKIPRTGRIALPQTPRLSPPSALRSSAPDLEEHGHLPTQPDTSSQDDQDFSNFTVSLDVAPSIGAHPGVDPGNLPEHAVIAIPLEDVREQLQRGRVALTAARLREIGGSSLQPALADLQDDEEISLPLQEIVIQLPPEALALRPDQRQKQPVVDSEISKFTFEEAMGIEREDTSQDTADQPDEQTAEPAAEPEAQPAVEAEEPAPARIPPLPMPRFQMPKPAQEEAPQEESAQPEAEAPAPVRPAPAFNFPPTPPPFPPAATAAAEPQTEPEPEPEPEPAPVAAAASTDDDDDPVVPISARSMADQFPGYQEEDIPADLKIQVPVELLRDQLSRGRVVLTREQFVDFLPENHHYLLNEVPEGHELVLPLREVVTSIPPEQLLGRGQIRQTLTIPQVTPEPLFKEYKGQTEVPQPPQAEEAPRQTPAPPRPPAPAAPVQAEAEEPVESAPSHATPPPLPPSAQEDTGESKTRRPRPPLPFQRLTNIIAPRKKAKAEPVDDEPEEDKPGESAPGMPVPMQTRLFQKPEVPATPPAQQPQEEPVQEPEPQEEPQAAAETPSLPVPPPYPVKPVRDAGRTTPGILQDDLMRTARISMPRGGKMASKRQTGRVIARPEAQMSGEAPQAAKVRMNLVNILRENLSGVPEAQDEINEVPTDIEIVMPAPLVEPALQQRLVTVSVRDFLDFVPDDYQKLFIIGYPSEDVILPRDEVEASLGITREAPAISEDEPVAEPQPETEETAAGDQDSQRLQELLRRRNEVRLEDAGPTPPVPARPPRRAQPQDEPEVEAAPQAEEEEPVAEQQPAETPRPIPFAGFGRQPEPQDEPEQEEEQEPQPEDTRTVSLSILAVLEANFGRGPENVSDQDTVVVPLQIVLDQISRGRVMLPYEQFLGYLSPDHQESIRQMGEIDEIKLPLQELFKTLPPDAFATKTPVAPAPQTALRTPTFDIASQPREREIAPEDEPAIERSEEERETLRMRTTPVPPLPRVELLKRKSEPEPADVEPDQPLPAAKSPEPQVDEESVEPQDQQDEERILPPGPIPDYIQESARTVRFGMTPLPGLPRVPKQEEDEEDVSHPAAELLRQVQRAPLFHRKSERTDEDLEPEAEEVTTPVEDADKDLPVTIDRSTEPEQQEVVEEPAETAPEEEPVAEEETSVAEEEQPERLGISEEPVFLLPKVSPSILLKTQLQTGEEEPEETEADLTSEEAADAVMKMEHGEPEPAETPVTPAPISLPKPRRFDPSRLKVQQEAAEAIPTSTSNRMFFEDPFRPSTPEDSWTAVEGKASISAAERPDEDVTTTAPAPAATTTEAPKAEPETETDEKADLTPADLTPAESGLSEETTPLAVEPPAEEKAESKAEEEEEDFVAYQQKGEAPAKPKTAATASSEKDESEDEEDEFVAYVPGFRVPRKDFQATAPVEAEKDEKPEGSDLSIISKAEEPVAEEKAAEPVASHEEPAAASHEEEQQAVAAGDVPDESWFPWIDRSATGEVKSAATAGISQLMPGFEISGSIGGFEAERAIESKRVEEPAAEAPETEDAEEKLEPSRPTTGEPQVPEIEESPAPLAGEEPVVEVKPEEDDDVSAENRDKLSTLLSRLVGSDEDEEESGTLTEEVVATIDEVEGTSAEIETESDQSREVAEQLEFADITGQPILRSRILVPLSRLGSVLPPEIREILSDESLDFEVALPLENLLQAGRTSGDAADEATGERTSSFESLKSFFASLTRREDAPAALTGRKSKSSASTVALTFATLIEQVSLEIVDRYFSEVPGTTIVEIPSSLIAQQTQESSFYLTGSQLMSLLPVDMRRDVHVSEGLRIQVPLTEVVNDLPRQILAQILDEQLRHSETSREKARRSESEGDTSAPATDIPPRPQDIQDRRRTTPRF